MTRYGTALLLCTGMILASCSASPPAKEVYYRFLEAVPAEPSGPFIAGTLRVERLRAEGILSERALLFSRRDSPGKVEQYRYHHWAEPPARLVTQGLIQYLQQAKVADKVITADMRTEVDYSIDGELLRMERVIDDGPSQVILEVLLRLQEFETRELVLQNRYQETVAVQQDNLVAVVDGLSLARERIYRRFVEDLSAFSRSLE